MHKFAYIWCLLSVSALVDCNTGSNQTMDSNGGESGNAGAGGDPGEAAGQSGSSDGGKSSTGGSGGTASTSTGGSAGIAQGGSTVGGGTGGSVAAGGSSGKPGGSGGAAAAGGAPGGPASVECSKLANCDTFETYTTAGKPAGPWTGFETSGGTIVVDETRGFGASKKSIKITVNPGGDMTARMRHMGTGVLPADELFMRMMVWIDAPPKGKGHWNWMWGEGNVSQKSGGQLSDAFVASGGNLEGGSWMLYGGGAKGGFQDCFASARTVLPVGRWACYEFHLDSKTNSVDAWIDGKFDEYLSVQDAQPLTGTCGTGFNYTGGLWYIPKVEKAFFGWKVYHTLTSTATAWLDDIAISTKRIGCPVP
jgi:hypothetical protein